MAIHQLICQRCRHKFYELTTPCQPLGKKIRCPLCQGEKLNSGLVKRPKEGKWSEDIGCRHQAQHSCVSCRAKQIL